MIEHAGEISLRKQAELLQLCRSNLYYKSVINKESEVANLINEVYLASDCRYGYRKITAELRSHATIINHKKVLKIMQDMRIKGLYPMKKYHLSKKTEHKIYPYLLADLIINRVNHVWATDLTYIWCEGKFYYFMAIIDLYSRYIINYQLSPSMDAEFCVYTLQTALQNQKPEIFNSDQGAQFTSKEFVNLLTDMQIKISMDHKGRCFDNIYVERLWRTLKQEAIYYYRPTNLQELVKVIKDFVNWYNYQRRHQSLNYQIPGEVYHVNTIK